MKAWRTVVTLAACAVVGAASLVWAEPAITVYNQNFAVVRDTVPLDLKAGVNQVKFTGVTGLLEPDSVILRDPKGERELAILEQNYRNDPVSQGLLLSLYEGKTIPFLVKGQAGQQDKIVTGTIVRSGYVPPVKQTPEYGPEYYYRNQVEQESAQPIIEVDGQLRFELPGLPLFAALTDQTILKPTLYWLIQGDQPGQFDAELAYVTGGMTWAADYNVAAPEKSETMDLVGWVTIQNNAGRTFENARIKLMAGDVSKVVPEDVALLMAGVYGMEGRSGKPPPITEKAFEEYHLYTLQRPTTLHDRQTKQVEFVRAAGVKAARIYVYDGAKIDWPGWRGYLPAHVRQDPAYGTQFNTKVWVMREFKNSEENNLGMPLPAGRMRFYQQDDDRQLEFIGENVIDHTPKDELIRVYTGNAFDIVGQRKRTNFRVDSRPDTARESFEIKVRNHKTEPVEVRAVEHLYRWTNWEITGSSQDFRKTDAQTIEFPVAVPPDGEKTVTYTVLYSW